MNELPIRQFLTSPFGKRRKSSKRGSRKMNSPLWRCAKSIVSFLLLTLPCICFGQGLNGKANISPDLAAMVVANSANPNAIFNVILQFAVPPDPQELALINANAAWHSPETVDLSVIQAQYLSLPAQALANVANDPNVVYISPDRPVAPSLDISNVTTGAQTALSYGWNGSGIGVAIIDSGILLPQTDLLNTRTKNASRVVYSQS